MRQFIHTSTLNFARDLIYYLLITIVYIRCNSLILLIEELVRWRSFMLIKTFNDTYIIFHFKGQ